MAIRFDGRRALVTGAASGLGRNHAVELARRGAHVMMCDISSEIENLAAELAAEGHSVVARIADIGDEESATRLVRQTVEKFGGIDLLVNNAGSGTPAAVQDLSTTKLRETFDVHLLGSFWTTREALPYMRDADFGRIVNTSSALGAFGAPGQAAYVMAKAAILGLTRATALDNLDRNIRVNSLAPVASTPLADKYFAKVFPHLDLNTLSIANVTPAVLFLLSDDCALNGETIAVGGGRMARIFTATGPGYRPGTLRTEEIPGNIDTVMSTTQFEVLTKSEEQYRFL